MKFKFLGRNGLQVSAFGFGCMGLSHAYGAPINEDEVVAIDKLLSSMEIRDVFGCSRIVGKSTIKASIYRYIEYD